MNGQVTEAKTLMRIKLTYSEVFPCVHDKKEKKRSKYSSNQMGNTIHLFSRHFPWLSIISVGHY